VILRRVGLAALIAATAFAAARAETAPRQPEGNEPALLLGREYPIEVSISFHAGLLHWLDSLTALGGAGMTAGKTREAHRLQYVRTHGEPTPTELRVLERFRAARIAFARDAEPDRRNALTLAVLEATTMKDAIAATEGLLDEEHATAMAQAFEFFTPRYRTAWRDGEIPRRFLEKVRGAKQAGDVAAFLVRVARFYGADPEQEPLPRVTLVPVPRGFGTHAQAIGRHLLIEIRRGEGLADEVSPIVHENAHFLFDRMPPRARVALTAVGEEEHARAWAALAEALPTAIAQGVAGERFGRGWSREKPWYHFDEIDAYAKAIFPRIERALDGGEAFDAALLRELLGLFPAAEDATRR
jgi:hypothetical protein